MRRTLAIALAATLLVGGCARHQAGAESPAPARPAASSTDRSDLAGGTAADVAADGTTAGDGTAGDATAGNRTDDVDRLLDQVDKQLRSDDQPAEDQD